MKALAPARVREVRIHPDTGTAEVIVPDFQLSLAIGKEGQNARLAARLTGWRVDIKSESPARGRRSGRRRRVRRGRVGHQRHRRAGVAAGRGRRGDLGGRGGLRGAGPRDRGRADAAPQPHTPRSRRRPQPTPRHRGRTPAERHAAPRPQRRGRAPAEAPAEARQPATHPPRRRRPTASEATAGPVRTCIGCRRAAGVEELVRIRAVPTASGPSGLELGAGPGRGAWLCRSTRLRASTRRSAGGRSSGHCAPRYGMTRSSAYARDCSPVNRRRSAGERPVSRNGRSV